VGKSQTSKSHLERLRQSDLKAVWNRTPPAQRMAFVTELLALSKPHTRTFGKGDKINTNEAISERAVAAIRKK